MTNLDSVLKSRDITFPTAVHLVKTMVFPVVRYGCESWAIKKAEGRRIVVQKNWQFLGLEGEQISQPQRESTPNIHWKDWCWSSNPLATEWEELTHWKRPWYWERLKAKGEEGDRMKWLDSITKSMDVSLSKLWEIVKDRRAWHAAVHAIIKSWTWLSN